MSLAERCRHLFSDSLRQRGAEFHRSGRVRILDEEDAFLLASVVDPAGRVIEVYLQWKDGQRTLPGLLVECTHDGELCDPICPHTWAVLLECDQYDLNQEISGTGPLTLLTEDHESASPPSQNSSSPSQPVSDPFCPSPADDWPGPKEAGQPLRPGLSESAGGGVARRGQQLASVLAGQWAPEELADWDETPQEIPQGDWRVQLEAVRNLSASQLPDPLGTHTRAEARQRRAWYIIDAAESRVRGRLIVQLHYQETKKNGQWGKLKPLPFRTEDFELFQDNEDRELLAILAGSEPESDASAMGLLRDLSTVRGVRQCALSAPLYDSLLPRLCRTGRVSWVDEDPDPLQGRANRRRERSDQPRPIRYDDGPAWRFELFVEPGQQTGTWRLDGRLRQTSPPDQHGQQSHQIAPLDSVILLMGAISRGTGSVSTGIVLLRDRVGRLEPGADSGWIRLLRSSGPIIVPQDQQQELVEQLWQMPQLPPVALPEELRWDQVQVSPEPAVVFTRLSAQADGGSPELGGSVQFLYDGHSIGADHLQAAIVDRAGRRVLVRDRRQEHHWLVQLQRHGVKPAPGYLRDRCDVTVPAKLLPQIVPELMLCGWQVEAEGHRVRTASGFRVSVSSQQDWFEVAAEADFGGLSVPLPRLLGALERGERLIKLDDGTQGMLPEQWLRSYVPLAALGTCDGGGLKFGANQAALLDTLLQAQPEVDVDVVFDQIRQKLRAFDGVRPECEPQGFCGTLREYQREGLGWLGFLQEFGFGGCLADDMGLGKTIQVLALLEARRQEHQQQEHQQQEHQQTEPSSGIPADGQPGQSETSPRASAERGGPSESPQAPTLVVVPRSLVQNWLEEAARFTPQLKMLDYTGLQRNSLRKDFHRYHVIVTTYGTLRRDIAKLKDQPFDYCILDEAQAIKNPNSQAAKACRLVQARHRLAMTGTPVENHLGELWSIFEFLNPGMLGASDSLRRIASLGRSASLAAPESPHPTGQPTGETTHSANGTEQQLTKHQVEPGIAQGNVAVGDLKNSSDSCVSSDKGESFQQDESLNILAKALRPFLLRRTKEQVLTELPEKFEQTMYCELGREQRKLYDELRLHYRQSLLKKVEQDGLNKSKIQVLEALLRLRQAACHPGLIDPNRRGDDSAKMEALSETLSEVIAEGHKALVFSQFTSLLSIVRQRLEADGVTYEYLDGRTRKRAERVQRFQTDPHCPLFLISLRAGGLGLNLTAADYVFILDPWWNPAVEAQAVDRAHRIGQTRKVFAYRLICRDTVEEKILELQRDKRQLAEAIVSEDNSVLADLSAEDLQLLLS